MPLRSLRRLKPLLEFEPKCRAVVESRIKETISVAGCGEDQFCGEVTQVEPESKVQLTTKTA